MNKNFINKCLVHLIIKMHQSVNWNWPIFPSPVLTGDQEEKVRFLCFFIVFIQFLYSFTHSLHISLHNIQDAIFCV